MWGMMGGRKAIIVLRRIRVLIYCLLIEKEGGPLCPKGFVQIRLVRAFARTLKILKM